MTRIAADWLGSEPARAVCAALEGAGHKALFVGGCVRNALLGVPVDDLDLATDATPQEVTGLLERSGLKVVPTGVEHGTVTAVIGSVPIEITTLRRDIETFGRHARVTFSTDVREDAARRDFTMNALYCDIRGSLVDPLGGLPDLLERRLRFVGDPEERVQEDYLRILRFFRFHAWYANPGGGFDSEGLAACAAHVSGLRHISAERIGSEMRKLLSAPDPAPAVATMQAAGVLATILPGADARPLGILVAMEDQPDPILRLAALGGENVPQRLRLSRKDARKLEAISGGARGDDPPAVLGYRLGPDLGRAALILRGALLEAPPSPEALDEVAQGAAARFPVTARDLMPEYDGAALGERLKALEARWLASGMTLDRDALLG